MSAEAAGKQTPLGKLIVVAMIAAGLAVLIGANAHLVHAAFTSQPECVTHLKTAGEPESGFRAAKSSC